MTKRYTNKKTGKQIEVLSVVERKISMTYYRRVKNGVVVGNGSFSMPTETFLKNYEPAR